MKVTAFSGLKNLVRTVTEGLSQCMSHDVNKSGLVLHPAWSEETLRKVEAVPAQGDFSESVKRQPGVVTAEM